MVHNMGITLTVEGMSCQHCVANVKNALEALDGVVQATPDLASGKVVIEGENLHQDLLKKAITDAGYVPV
jgi:copper chaperone CopZ